jgi:creatinine amidohydrolase
MRLEDLNWMDVEKYLAQDDRLILVLGACEQHAYLSLLTDIKIPLAADRRAGGAAAELWHLTIFRELSRHTQPASFHHDRGG